MKRLQYIFGLLLVCSVSEAGLITHTDYTAGNVITAAGQNTNENAIVNEFNGNIDNTNIKTGGIISSNILDGTIVPADLSTVLQSSITAYTNYASYRRPNLKYVSTSLIDVSTNTTTANQTCIFFPDGERRCVTEDTGSANKYRRWDVTAVCQFTTGTEDSGLIGATAATNTWYALYAVKSTLDTTKYVVCGTTNTPVQQNASELNRMFATNGYAYLGLARYGDGSGASTSLLAFSQDGDMTIFDNAVTANSVTMRGILMATVSSGNSISWSYSTGTTGSVAPLNSDIGYFDFLALPGGTGTTSVGSGNSGTIFKINLTSNVMGSVNVPLGPVRFSSGISASVPATSAGSITLSGFRDVALSGALGSQY